MVQANSHPDIFDEWRVEVRSDGCYVTIEEIGAQGELGPFGSREAARAALNSYLRGEIADPTLSATSSRQS